MNKLFLFLITTIFVCFLSCSKEQTDKADKAVTYKIVSQIYCPSGQLTDMTNDDLYMSFSSSYKPTPNTWYTSNNSYWFKTGSDVTAYNIPISMGVLETPYANAPCQKVPTLTTTIIKCITNTTAISGGNISDAGNSPIIKRGVVWSTSISPTIALNTKTIDGTGTGIFTSNLTNLTTGSTYYVRAYATNEVGTSYGAEKTFKAVIPQTTILIGSQTWKVSNLDVTKYQDGTDIPQVTNPTQWDNLTTGAWCYFNNDIKNNCMYGKLYNWYAVAGIFDEASKTDLTKRKKLAPIGYHIPTDAEWTTLTNNLGGINVAGTKMKSTDGWMNNGNGNNSSGFTGLSGGYRFADFANFGYIVRFWSSSEYCAYGCGNSYAIARGLDYNKTSVQTLGLNTMMTYGFYVRCIKD